MPGTDKTSLCISLLTMIKKGLLRSAKTGCSEKALLQLLMQKNNKKKNKAVVIIEPSC